MIETDDKRPEAGASLPDEGFASRWLRLKQQSGETLSVDATQVARQPVDEPPESVPELTDQDMPPLDSLGADSDFSPFLSPKVSEALRRLALRKLFHGDAFNVCDGLDDYAEDFTRFSGLGDLLTADMKHQLQRLLDEEAMEAEAQTSPVDKQAPYDPATLEGSADDDPIALRPGNEPESAAVTAALASDQDEVERI